MSLGWGRRQRDVLDAMEAMADADKYRYGPHCYRWYTLEMCGLLTTDTPTSDRSSLNRAVRLLAADGQIELCRARYPYDLSVVVRQTEPTLVADLDPRTSAPGRRLWFRKVGGPPLFTAGVLEWAEEWFPDDDVSWRFYEWYHGSEEWWDFVYARDSVTAHASELGRFLRWYLFGPETTA